MDLHEGIKSLMKAFLDPGLEGLVRVELGGIRCHEDSLMLKDLISNLVRGVFWGYCYP